MTGYSTTLLARKLGIKPGHSVAVLSAPQGVQRALEPLPAGVILRDDLATDADLDVVVLFARWQADLDEHLATAAGRLAPAGGLWVAWPKKAARQPTDLGFAAVQGAGLQLGLVDNKTCAIDEVYSGLRFVVRREHREAWAAGQRI